MRHLTVLRKRMLLINYVVVNCTISRTLAESLEYVQKALAIIRKVGDVYLEGNALVVYGKTQHANGEYDKVFCYLYFIYVIITDKTKTGENNFY
jgi:hypothetical protein